MLDFHSHILPDLDDGSKDYEMSLEMLRESKKQGVDIIVSTSHCYPHGEDSVDRFIKRRNDRLLKLNQFILDSGEDLPKIKHGCELNLYTDISDYDNLEPLCIEGTSYILLEMPYGEWKEWMFDCIYNLSIKGFKPIIAHIDRYLSKTNEELCSLFDVAKIYQINAEAFLYARERKNINTLISEGHAHILGSDMHNMDTRITKIKKAVEVIEKKFGTQYVEFFEQRGNEILNDKPVDFKACENLVRKKFRLFGK